MGFVTNQRPMTSYFTGFSTVNTSQTGTTQLSDAALIRQDLLNQFNTIYGERIMRPNYGSKIWLWLMDPDTTAMQGLVFNDVERVILSDGRVQIITLTIDVLDQGYRVSADLFYAPIGVYQTFTFDFEQRQSNTTSGNGF